MVRLACAAILVASSAAHGAVTLNFDTLPDQVPVAGQYLPDFFFYDGNTGVDSDFTSNFGLHGQCANEPSGEGTLYFLPNPTNQYVIDILPGATSVSFQYSALVPYQVDLYDSYGGAGSNVGGMTLPFINQTNPGDPTGVYTTWSLVNIPQSNKAYSMVIIGVPYELRIDDMGFDLVPAPGAPMALGLAGLVALRRRR